MKSEELIKFAQQLKTAREEASLSLEQISAKSRIDIKFLQAIEEGNYEVLPEVYIKAFIKQYAVQVGLDPDETIANYEAAKRGRLRNNKEAFVEEKEDTVPPPPTSNPPAEKTFKAPEEEEKKSHKKEFGTDDTQSISSYSESKSSSINAKLILTIAAVIVLLGAVYFFFINKNGTEIVRETPFDEIIQENEEPVREEKGDRFEMADEQPASEAADGIQNVTANSDSLSLRLTATDSCWLSADIDDGSLSDEYFLYPQQSITVKARKNFELILGNSGGVDIFLNGKKLDLNVTSSGRKVVRINENGIVNNSN